MGLQKQQILAPINEAVFLLDRLAPGDLNRMRDTFPSLSDELKLGRIGGLPNEADDLDLARAEVMCKALVAGKDRATAELVSARRRMTSAQRWRMRSQIASLVCGSGVLAGLAIRQETMTVVIAVLALLVSIGTLLAEHKERLLTQGDGDIYSAYDFVNQAVFKASLLAENLELLIKYRAHPDDLRAAIAAANALCEDLNRWISKIVGSDSSAANAVGAAKK